MRVHMAIGDYDPRGERFTRGDNESLVSFADRVDSVLRAKLGLLDGENHSFVQRQIEAARADGYRAGVEAAAKTVERYFDPDPSATCDQIAKAIRALAPAATTEKP